MLGSILGSKCLVNMIESNKFSNEMALINE